MTLLKYNLINIKTFKLCNTINVFDIFVLMSWFLEVFSYLPLILVNMNSLGGECPLPVSAFQVVGSMTMHAHYLSLSWLCGANPRLELGSAALTTVVYTKQKFLHPLPYRATRGGSMIATVPGSFQLAALLPQYYDGSSSQQDGGKGRKKGRLPPGVCHPDGCCTCRRSELSYRAIPTMRESENSFYSKKPGA